MTIKGNLINNAFIRPVTGKQYEKKTPDKMTNSEIKRKLCFMVSGGCPKCECLRQCLYGQEAIKRGIKQ